MAEKDMTEKLLEDYNDVFADIINVLLFNGKQRVKPESLEKSNLKSQYKADDGKLHEQERDVMKYWREGGIRLAVYGLENQTVIDEQMPVRIFGYEGANYRSQYGDKQIIPVVTVVLHFGTERRWNKPVNLKELMSIPDELEPFVNDCHMNVIDVAWLTDEQLEQFKSDFGIVANFFVNKRKNPKYVPDDKRKFKHVDAVLKFLGVMTGDKEYENLLNNPNFKKEGANMCSVVQNLKEEGRFEEIFSSVQEGDYSLERGAQKAGMTIAEFEKAMEEAGYKVPAGV